MKNDHKKVALITGVSSGIGAETVRLLLKAGYNVWGAARHHTNSTNSSEENSSYHYVYLDLTDKKSIETCVNTLLEAEGKIDLLVNNAGYGQYGPVETTPIEDAQRQLDVNLLGLARLVQLVLPQMREQGGGRIINISSMAGKMYTAYGAWYHASKFALEAFSDCLRWEIKKWGIKVILIEPGCIRTPWSKIAFQHLVENSQNTPYELSATKVAHTMEKLYRNAIISKPALIAHTILKAAISKHPRTRYLIGFLAKPSILLRRILPDKIFDKLLNFIEG